MDDEELAGVKARLLPALALVAFVVGGAVTVLLSLQAVQAHAAAHSRGGALGVFVTTRVSGCSHEKPPRWA